MQPNMFAVLVPGMRANETQVFVFLRERETERERQRERDRERETERKRQRERETEKDALLGVCEREKESDRRSSVPLVFVCDSSEIKYMC